MFDSDFNKFTIMWGYLSEIYGKPMPSEMSLKIIFGTANERARAAFIIGVEAAQSMIKKTFPPVLRGADNLCKTVEVVKCDVVICGMLQLPGNN